MPHSLNISPEEEMQALRDTMFALLKVDPHCRFANLLGQRLMDLIEQQYG